MNYKVSTFKFSILNRRGEKHFLANLPGNIDFQDLFDEFCEDIFSNTKKFNENGKDKSLTLREPHKFNKEERHIFGKFDAGTTGDPVNINDPETNETNYSVSPDELQARILNFYVQIPRNKQEGFIILQRKSTHSIQKSFEDCFNSFLVRKGFQGENRIRIKLSHAPNSKLMKRMMDVGELKEINLERNIIPNSFSGLFEGVSDSNFGTITTQLTFQKPATKDNFKQALYNIYNKSYTGDEQVEIEGNFYDEVSFTFHLDKVTKTFFVKDKTKTRSEIDITSMLDGESLKGEIPLDKFVEISIKLILEIS
ncbi:hypothetical protein ACMGDK_16785 [Chryseobacterium sp. DT-3]|uniref:hypothetical protein n=1 Tax=Chryseobacterium sp. DT-3 TaxID=3396164 RepID=UPI003F19B308